jgi:protein farnesyltransferase/geranylgeranyltransferase type-1 subunit alpha
VLDHAKIPYSELQAFVLPYSLPQPPLGTPPEVVDLESPLPSKDSQLPCVAAVEFMADIHEAAGGSDLVKATEVGYVLHDLNKHLTHRSFGNPWQMSMILYAKGRSLIKHFGVHTSLIFFCRYWEYRIAESLKTKSAGDG